LGPVGSICGCPEWRDMSLEYVHLERSTSLMLDKGLHEKNAEEATRF